MHIESLEYFRLILKSIWPPTPNSQYWRVRTIPVMKLHRFGTVYQKNNSDPRSWRAPSTLRTQTTALFFPRRKMHLRRLIVSLFGPKNSHPSARIKGPFSKALQWGAHAYSQTCSLLPDRNGTRLEKSQKAADQLLVAHRRRNAE